MREVQDLQRHNQEFTGLMELTGLRGRPISPVSPIYPEIPDCPFVSPIPPAPPGFFPCHPGMFLKYYSQSKVGGLAGIVCHGAFFEQMSSGKPSILRFWYPEDTLSSAIGLYRY